MNKKTSKIISLILSIALVLNLFPINVLADSYNNSNRNVILEGESEPSTSPDSTSSPEPTDEPVSSPSTEPTDDPVTSSPEPGVTEEPEISPEPTAITLPTEIEPESDVTVDTRGTEPDIEFEDISKRTQYEKEFYCTGGMRLKVDYPEPVHYKEDGKWKDIDNTLVSDTDDDKNDVYSNKSSDFKVKLPKDLSSDKPVSIKFGKYNISFSMDGNANLSTAMLRPEDKSTLSNLKGNQKKVRPTGLYTSLIYPEVYYNTDIQYEIGPNSLKETVIFKGQPEEGFSFSCAVKAPNLYAVKSDDNSIVFYSDKEKKDVVFTIPAPFMIDESGEDCTDIAVELTEKGSTYTLTYTPSSKWLGESGRVWPVKLDPTLKTPYTYNIVDTHVMSANPNSNYNGSYYIEAGYSESRHKERIYLKYSTLPSFNDGEIIVASYLSMLRSTTSATATLEMDVHKVTGVWDVDEITWEQQDGDAGDPVSIDPTVIDLQRVENGSYTWVITDIVKGWYNPEGINYGNTGMVLKMPASIEAYTTSAARQFWACENGNGYRPVLLTYYMSNVGLQDSWDFATGDLGKSGAANVNLFSGAFVYTHTDLAMNGSRMPITISHIFNSVNRNDSDNQMLYGNGWRTNYDQRQFSVETVGGENCYRYIDQDGTTHYFTKQDDVWKDESGLGYKLVITNSIPTITDKNKNKMVFQNQTSATMKRRLDYIEDRNGNRQTLGYTAFTIGTSTEYLITSITDGARAADGTGGRVVYFNRYNNDPNHPNLEGFLRDITDPSGRQTTYTYDDNTKQLIRITYPDDSYTVFAYDATTGDITSATGSDGRKLTFEYTGSKVMKMVESAGEGVNTIYGSELSFNYMYNRTDVTDAKGRTSAYQFDDYGHTVCIIGPDGSAAYAKFSKAANGSMNKITSISNTQKFGKNYLINHNFEVTQSGWNAGGSDTSATVNYTTTDKYLGDDSAYVIKNVAAGNAYTYQIVTNMTPGNTYTLSGYIKTAGITGTGTALMVDYKVDTVTTSVGTKRITGTNAWQRYQVTFTLPENASPTVVVYGETTEATGTAWFDCVQLEDGVIANRYNIINNADFDYVSSGLPVAWTTNNFSAGDGIITDSDDTNPDYMSDNRLHYIGEAKENKYIEQQLYVNGSAGDCFVVGGWAKGNSIPVRGSVKYGFAIKFSYVGQDDPWVYSQWQFNSVSEVWQYLCDKIIAKYDYTNVTIRVEINYNANTVDYDGIQVFKEGFDNQITYDDNGNVTKITYPNGKSESFTYDANNNVTLHTYPDSTDATYTYDAYNNMTMEVLSTNTTTRNTYDGDGNVTMVRVGGTANYVQNTTAYTSNNNYVDSTTDPFNKTTDYSYDPNKGTLISVTVPISSTETSTVSNTYDDDTDLPTGTSMTVGGAAVSNSYGYTNNLLTSISHNASSGSVNYEIIYNILGMTTETKVGDQTLVKNTYEPLTKDGKNYITGRLESAEYYNGGAGGNQTINYVYDNYDRLIEVRDTSDNLLYKFAYDNRGDIGYLYDVVQDVTYYSVEDVMNRVESVKKQYGDGTWSTSAYAYNNNSELTGFTEASSQFNAAACGSTTYAYNNDGKPLTVTLTKEGVSENMTYDTFKRAPIVTYKQGTTARYTVTPTFYPGESTVCTKSQRIQSISYNSADSLAYTYDDRGFILSMTKDANNYSQFRYNGLGELVRENYKWGAVSYTMIYAYDVGGNITSKTQYAFEDGDGTVGAAISTLSYSYGDTNWKDKLTSYTVTENGNSTTYDVSYDDIGNPLSDDTWNYTWTQGRKLQQIQKTGTTASYKYNSDGIRTEKTVNDATTVYNLVGSKITFEKTDDETAIYYYYDPDGKLVGLNYEGEAYFYIRNAQGEIIKLISEAGAVVVEYSYDAWGNNLGATGSMAGTLGEDNPFRYKGYYYDTESGLYYLNSRYYNPEWGRFINADTVLGQTGGLLTHNLFAYCANNPVMASDPNGHWFEWLLKAVAIVVVVAAIVTATVMTVSTCGAGSIAGVAMISGALTVAARMTEVAALQTKKSINDGDSAGEVATDVVNAVFDNGSKIFREPSVVKTATTTGALIKNNFKLKNLLNPQSFKNFVKGPASKMGTAVAYVFTALNWGETFRSITCYDPVYRAKQRGYDLY